MNVLATFLFIHETVIYSLSLIFIETNLYNRSIKKQFIPICCLILFITICTYFVTYETIYFVFLPVLHFIQVCGINLIIRKSKLFHLCGIFLAYYLINTIIVSGISFLLSDHKKILIEFVVHVLTFLVCILFCFTKFSIKIKVVIFSTTKKLKLFLIVLLFIGCILIICMQAVFVSPTIVRNPAFYVVTYLFLVLFVLSLTILFPVLLLLSTSNKYLKTLTENYEKQIEAQAKHYEAQAKANFELRRFQHDFKNIKVGVGKLIAEERLTEAISMLDSTNEDIYNTTNSLLCFDTGNGIVDALLAEKQRNAALSNIKIKFEGAVPSSNISATELCVLFGNTIDNAIEACEKINIENEKIINVTCKCNSNFMFLDITNPVSKPIIIKNNTLATTKADKTLHGFGLYSLDQIVRKHDGELNLTCDNYEFKVNISMFVDI